MLDKNDFDRITGPPWRDSSDYEEVIIIPGTEIYRTPHLTNQVWARDKHDLKIERKVEENVRLKILLISFGKGDR